MFTAAETGLSSPDHSAGERWFTAEGTEHRRGGGCQRPSCPLSVCWQLTVAYFSLVWGGVFCPGHFGAEAQEFLQIYSNGKDTKEISKRQGAVRMTGAMNEKIYHPPWPLMASKGILLKMSLGILYWLVSVWCMCIFKGARNWQILQRLHKRGLKRNACHLLVFPVTLALMIRM